MAQADMAERIEHAFVRQHAVGKYDLVADLGEIIGHGRFLLFDWAAVLSMPAEQSRNGRHCQAVLESRRSTAHAYGPPRGAREKTALPRRHDVSRLRAAPPPNRRTTHESSRRRHRARHD